MSIEDKNLVQDTKQTTFHRHNGVDSPQLFPKDLLGVSVGQAIYNPPSLIDGAGTTTTVTVTGALLGDMALASFSKDLQGITLTAYVSSSGVVSVRFQNESGGTLDLASGIIKAVAIRF